MPLYQVDVQKKLGTEYWTNVYHVEVAGLGEALTQGGLIASFERAIHLDIVQFTSMRVRPYPSTGDTGTVAALGYYGNNTGQGPYMPLFNTLNVILAVPVGRPSRKYLRLPIPEASQENGSFLQPFIDDWTEQYCNELSALGTLRDVDGQTIGDISCVLAVGMRQLRRGSRRRLEPVIPV